MTRYPPVDLADICARIASGQDADTIAAHLAQDLADPEFLVGLTTEQAEVVARFSVWWMDGAGQLRGAR